MRSLIFLSLLLLLPISAFASPVNGQTLSAEQKERIDAVVNRQVEISLKSLEGIRKQSEILTKILTFNLEILNKRIKGAGLPPATSRQLNCLQLLNSYPNEVVIKTSPNCRNLPLYIRKASKNLRLTTAEEDELNQLQLAFDSASIETRQWQEKNKDFATSVQEGNLYKPIPGPLLKELYSLLFVNVDSNKYKIDFKRMEYVPKSKNEYLENPFDLFWKAIGDYIHQKIEIKKSNENPNLRDNHESSSLPRMCVRQQSRFPLLQPVRYKPRNPAVLPLQLSEPCAIAVLQPVWRRSIHAASDSAAFTALAGGQQAFYGFSIRGPDGARDQ